MRPLIEKYAEQIGRLASTTVAKVLNQEPVPQWSPSTEPLGTGSWGVVYPLADEKFVLKVTADPTEGPIVAKIMSEPQLYNHMGIIHYFALRQLPERASVKANSKGYPVYVIVAERLKDVGELTSHMRSYVRSRDHELAYQLSEVKEAATPLVKEKRRKKPRQWMVDKLDQEYMNRVAQIDDSVLCDFFYQFRDATNDGVLADVHTNNVGKRAVNWYKVTNGEIPLEGNDTYWVISDPGHSSLEEHPSIEELRNNPRRR